jgi:FG-GAP-like repeat/Bacterial Ig-like domain (group 2)/FG-GAP repeat
VFLIWLLEKSMCRFLRRLGLGVADEGCRASFRISVSVAFCSLWILVSCGGGSKPPAEPTLQSISISPANGTVAAGLKQQYKAMGNYSNGTTKDLSTIVTWATSNTMIATVSFSGLVTTVKQGSVSVSATSETIIGDTSLTIGPPNLVSINVSPTNQTVYVDQFWQFVAMGNYTDGSSQNLTNVTWSSSATSIATINGTGLAMGVAPGNSTIEASSGNVNGSTTLTVTEPPLPAVTYSLGQTFASGGTNPNGLVVADFNGDGKPDIAVSNSTSNTISVFLNDGSGNFGAPILTTVQAQTNISTLGVGDFNEDGKADLVVSTTNSTIMLFGNGDGTFSQQPTLTNVGNYLQAKVVDINGDGHLDLALAASGGCSVAFGKGDGTFSSIVGLAAAEMPGLFFGLAVADFNGDGKLDIVAPDYGYSQGYLDFWAGNGNTTFANATSVNILQSGPGSVASGDFDGDGKQDVLIGFLATAEIAPGNGDGTFNFSTGLRTVYSGNFTPTSGGITVFATPLTSNGKVDAVTSDYSLGTLQIAFNEALGQAPPAPGIFSFALAPGLSVIAAGDLNGDGALDVVVINNETSQVTTVLSKTQ